jgi:hypothetical protein
MNVAKLNGLICGAFLSAALLAAPAVTLAQDASASPVTCKDGTTAAHGGRGACKGHGGINKAAGAQQGSWCEHRGSGCGGGSCCRGGPCCCCEELELHQRSRPGDL